MTKILRQIFLVALSCCATAQSGGHEHLGPAPLEADDSLFPTVGPILVSVSMLATIKSDGRVSQTKVLDTIRGTNDFYQGTLIGYLDDAVAAATRWRFDPAIDSDLRPIESLASITFLYAEFGEGALHCRHLQLSPRKPVTMSRRYPPSYRGPSIP